MLKKYDCLVKNSLLPLVNEKIRTIFYSLCLSDVQYIDTVLECSDGILELEIDNLTKILNGEVDLIDQVNVRDIVLYEDNVLIQPQHVRKMLIDFLQGKISADDLTKWAIFITLRGEYVCVPISIPRISKKFDDIADYYEDMMYVIQRLSTPEIDGEVTKERVKLYLKELDKYKDDDVHDFFKK